MKRARWVVLQAGLVAFLTACGGNGTDPASSDLTLGGPMPPTPPGAGGDRDAPEVAVRPPIGGPIEGLTSMQLAEFERGRAVFERRFTPSSGLGPLYNATSCASCHSTPVTGGSSQLYRNFYIAAGGNPGMQFELPGLPSFVVPAYGGGIVFSLERGRTVIPASFGGVIPVTQAQRNGVNVLGTGLFEFVSNLTIISNSDPNDLDGDGISGRYNQDGVGLGRFGNRAQTNNVELFTRGPLFNQMGITTEPHDGSNATVSFSCSQVGSDPNDANNDLDGVDDPELSDEDLGDLLAFTRFLAPIGKLEPFTASAYRGQALFDQIGCTDCHIPSLPSSPDAPTFGIPVEAYTDLLLHDMGTALADGISMGTPQPSSIEGTTTHTEWRTAPLWGVSFHGPFLHDGRAETLHDAIEMHAGEGLAARNAYLALTSREQADLIEFLEHL